MSYEIHFPPSPCVLLKRVKAQHKSFSSNAETLTEAVQCTDDQEGSQPVEQAGHSRYGARKFLGGKIKIIKRPFTIVEFCQWQKFCQSSRDL